MAQFVKGARRPVNAGRKPGSANKSTPLLKDAILLAGCVAGNRLVELEIIERHARDTAENDSPESAGELKQAVEEHGSLVGFCRGLHLGIPMCLVRCLAVCCRSKSASIVTRKLFTEQSKKFRRTSTR
jgi:hypothetical protein